MKDPIKHLVVWHDQLGVGKIRDPNPTTPNSCWVSFLHYAPDILVEDKYLRVLYVPHEIQQQTRGIFSECKKTPLSRSKDRRAGG